VIVAIFAGSQRLTSASRIVSAPAREQETSNTAKILNNEDIAIRYQLPAENSSPRQNSFLVAEVRHLAPPGRLAGELPSQRLAGKTKRACGAFRVKKIYPASTW
jgi:hypothetical protein